MEIQGHTQTYAHIKIVRQTCMDIHLRKETEAEYRHTPRQSERHTLHTYKRQTYIQAAIQTGREKHTGRQRGIYTYRNKKREADRYKYGRRHRETHIHVQTHRDKHRQNDRQRRKQRVHREKNLQNESLNVYERKREKEIDRDMERGR